MQVGDVVKYFGSLTEYHGIYHVAHVPVKNGYGYSESVDGNGVTTVRGYVIENADGKRLSHVSSNSIALA